MTKLDLQYDVINMTPADANPVESNFSRTEQFINQELIERDGTVAMRAQLKLFGDPVNALDAVPKQYVEQIIPIGVIMMYGGVGAPAGTKWAECNGAELDQATYPDLFAIIGTRYVTGTPTAGRFNLPNLNGRFPMGTNAGATPAVGGTGGARDMPIVNHTHPINHDHASFNSLTQSVNHTHVAPDHTHSVNITSGNADAFHVHQMKGVEGPTGGAVSALGLNRVIDYGAGGSSPIFGATSADAPAHKHVVSGNTGTNTPATLTTGVESANHTHPIDVPAFTGTSGNPTGGVAVTDANLPPYVGVTYIIRVA